MSCECVEMDWSDVDMSLEHHPECGARKKEQAINVTSGTVHGPDGPWLEIAVMRRPAPSLLNFNSKSFPIPAVPCFDVLRVNLVSLNRIVSEKTTRYRYLRPFDGNPTYVLIGKDVLAGMCKGAIPEYVYHRLEVQGVAVYLIGWMEGVVCLPELLEAK